MRMMRTGSYSGIRLERLAVKPTGTLACTWAHRLMWLTCYIGEIERPQSDEPVQYLGLPVFDKSSTPENARSLRYIKLQRQMTAKTSGCASYGHPEFLVSYSPDFVPDVD